MKKELSAEIQKQIIPMLLAGGVGVLPTDTLYGVVGSALNESTVERIYKLRKRDLKKPMIILISSLKDLNFFGIDLTANQKKVLKNLWPGKVSVVLELSTCHPELVSGSRNQKGGVLKFGIPDFAIGRTQQVRNDTAIKDDIFRYLHRGKKTLAFRLPDDRELLKLLKKVGPLVAPSANLAGEKPAANILEAKKYFGQKVDFYVDAGTLKSDPSTLVAIDEEGKVEVLREGAVKIS